MSIFDRLGHVEVQKPSGTMDCAGGPEGRMCWVCSDYMAGRGVAYSYSRNFLGSGESRGVQIDNMYPVAIISLDRRKLHGESVEQWVYDGPTIHRDLCAGDSSADWVTEVLNDVCMPGVVGNRFAVYIRTRVHRYGHGYEELFDEVLEDYLLVPIGTSDQVNVGEDHGP